MTVKSALSSYGIPNCSPAVEVVEKPGTSLRGEIECSFNAATNREHSTIVEENSLVVLQYLFNEASLVRSEIKDAVKYRRSLHIYELSIS